MKTENDKYSKPPFAFALGGIVAVLGLAFVLFVTILRVQDIRTTTNPGTQAADSCFDNCFKNIKPGNGTYCRTYCENPPTATPTPNPTGTETPTPTPTGTPVPGEGTQIDRCWGSSDGLGGRCYDCDGNGEINILDFTCFRNNWQKTI